MSNIEQRAFIVFVYLVGQNGSHSRRGKHLTQFFHNMRTARVDCWLRKPKAAAATRKNARMQCTSCSRSETERLLLRSSSSARLAARAKSRFDSFDASFSAFYLYYFVFRSRSLVLLIKACLSAACYIRPPLSRSTSSS